MSEQTNGDRLERARELDLILTNRSGGLLENPNKYSEDYFRAEELYRLGKYKPALRKANQVLSLYSEHSEALELRTNILSKLEKQLELKTQRRSKIKSALVTCSLALPPAIMMVAIYGLFRALGYDIEGSLYAGGFGGFLSGATIDGLLLYGYNDKT